MTRSKKAQDRKSSSVTNKSACRRRDATLGAITYHNFDNESVIGTVNYRYQKGKVIPTRSSCRCLYAWRVGKATRRTVTECCDGR
ncbi:hypothetical protein J6590_017214 [Homalodisca vitripennis]|nr:hypothetical protein J6590_017214 [Homalodisca vitripennis]